MGCIHIILYVILVPLKKYKSIAEAYRKYGKPNEKLGTLKDLNIDNQTLGILCHWYGLYK